MYSPAVVGVQSFLYNPPLSLVTDPMSTTLPFGSIALSLTITPLGLGGLLSNVAF